MQWLKQSTAVTLKIGPFVDSTDGNTVEAGLTISQADVRLSMNGGNIAQKTEATSCTYDEVGMYDCPVDATDTGTLGRLDLIVNESGALIIRHSYMVVPANVWDSLFGADALQVHANEITAGLITATAIAADAIGASELAADAISEIADGILNRDLSTGTDSGSATVRTMRQALRFLRNKWTLAAGTLTVRKEDDTTTSWTATAGTDGSALPVVSVDPASA